MASVRFLKLLLLLLLFCAIASGAQRPPRRNVDYIDETVDEEQKATAGVNKTIDFTALKSELRTRIRSIFLPGEDQLEQLRLVIESAFANFAQANERKTTPTSSGIQSRLSNEILCGYNQICVPQWLCKTKKVNEAGKYEISFRSGGNDNPCGYMETCCSTDDIIDFKDSSDDDEMAACGMRNEGGVQMALARALNQEAEFGEFPWMTAILKTKDNMLEHIGGGSILAPTVVLTAAHKVRSTTPHQLVVRAGEWDTKSNQEIYPHIDRKVNQIILHENFSYSAKTPNNNIALLILDVPLGNSPHISPICLPSPNENFDNERCIVTGWGQKSISSVGNQRILKEVTVPVQPRDKCIRLLRTITYPSFNLDPTYICAGGEKDNDACHGDGGAPLVCPAKNNPNRYYQAGIVAWGISCGLENIPAAYTNVAFLTPWIIGQLNQLGIDKKYYTL